MKHNLPIYVGKSKLITNVTLTISNNIATNIVVSNILVVPADLLISTTIGVKPFDDPSKISKRVNFSFSPFFLYV